MKRIFTIASVLAIAVLISFSCKKSSAPTSGGGGGGNNNSNLPYGYLNVTKVYEIFGISSPPSYIWSTGNATFFSNPSHMTTTFSTVGSVSVGGIKFKLQTINNQYLDSTDMLSISPAVWQVMGAGVIPTFTYTYTDSVPGYTGYALLPDTIYRTQTLNLQINGVSRAGGISVVLMDGVGFAAADQAFQQITTVSTNNTIVIPYSSLSGFVPYSTSHGAGSMQITINNNITQQSFSGKPFVFGAAYQLTKNIYIK
ncbi:MAG: hypothetical protein ACYDCN_06215 [Bacteroidia bacterium]